MKTLLKIFFSMALLGWFALQIDWPRLMILCQQAKYLWLVLGLLCFLLLTIPHLFRWKIILNHLAVRCSHHTLFCWLWIGYFFNQLMPTAIGGGAMRLWYLKKEGHPWQTGLHSLIFDRAYALAGLAVLYIGLYLGSSLIVLPLIYRSAWYLCLGLLACFFALFCAAKSQRLVAWLALPMMRWMRPLWCDWQRLASVRVMSMLVGLSIASHLLNGFAFVAVTQAFHVPLALEAVFLMFPLMLLASMLPFSFAGWGVREGALVWLLSQYSVSTEQGFAVSIVYGVLQLGMGLVGGGVWLRRGIKTASLERKVGRHHAHKLINQIT